MNNLEFIYYSMYILCTLWLIVVIYLEINTNILDLEKCNKKDLHY